MIEDRPPRRRWPRNQRFSLSESGRAAESSYRSEIVASRARQGREAYEAARAAWAAPRGLQPDDGLYLGELTGHPKNLHEVADAVEACGKSREDTRLALDRLLDAPLIVADAT